VIFTVGHGTRSFEELVELLRAHDVAEVADVRTVPRSRRNPQFNRETLDMTLRDAGLGYTHLAGLGGWRRPRADSVNTAWRNPSFRGYADYMLTDEFDEHLATLIVRSRAQRIAIMCAESVPWRCHRSLIADALMARGVPVQHILSVARAEPHALTRWARVEGTVVTYPASQRSFDTLATESR